MGQTATGQQWFHFSPSCPPTYSVAPTQSLTGRPRACFHCQGLLQSHRGKGGRSAPEAVQSALPCATTTGQGGFGGFQAKQQELPPSNERAKKKDFSTSSHPPRSDGAAPDASRQKQQLAGTDAKSRRHLAGPEAHAHWTTPLTSKEARELAKYGTAPRKLSFWCAMKDRRGLSGGEAIHSALTPVKHSGMAVGTAYATNVSKRAAQTRRPSLVFS